MLTDFWTFLIPLPLYTGTRSQKIDDVFYERPLSKIVHKGGIKNVQKSVNMVYEWLHVETIIILRFRPYFWSQSPNRLLDLMRACPDRLKVIKLP